jgi:uncharacterized protein (DUF433 family)
VSPQGRLRYPEPEQIGATKRVRTGFMDWQEYIHSDSAILLGKPVVRGTRLAVDFILGLFAAGWTEQQVLESYPGLTPVALQAVFAFAVDCVKDEALYTTAGDAAAG